MSDYRYTYPKPKNVVITEGGPHVHQCVLRDDLAPGQIQRAACGHWWVQRSEWPDRVRWWHFSSRARIRAWSAVAATEDGAR